MIDDAWLDRLEYDIERFKDQGIYADEGLLLIEEVRKLRKRVAELTPKSKIVHKCKCTKCDCQRASEVVCSLCEREVHSSRPPIVLPGAP